MLIGVPAARPQIFDMDPTVHSTGATMSASSVIHSSEATFQGDVLQSSTPVLVDFWAEWCGPCRSIAPVLEEIAAERHDRLKVVKIDVDQNPQLARQYGIRGIPALLLFDGGEVRAQHTGALRRVELETFLDR
jgi:thioredoxin 1